MGAAKFDIWRGDVSYLCVIRLFFVGDIDIYQTPKHATVDTGRGKEGHARVNCTEHQTLRAKNHTRGPGNLITTQNPPIPSPGALEGGHVLTCYW